MVRLDSCGDIHWHRKPWAHLLKLLDAAVAGRDAAGGAEDAVAHIWRRHRRRVATVLLHRLTPAACKRFHIDAIQNHRDHFIKHAV